MTREGGTNGASQRGAARRSGGGADSTPVAIAPQIVQNRSWFKIARAFEGWKKSAGFFEGSRP